MKLKEIAVLLDGRLAGDGEMEIRGIASVGEAKEGDITFLASARFLKEAATSMASAFIVGEKMDTTHLESRSMIVAKNPLLAYARTAALFEEKSHPPSGVRPLAFVSAKAVISPASSISPFVYIDDGAVIERHVVVYPSVHIGKGVTIGENTIIYPNATIHAGSRIGKRVIIHAGAVIGSDGFGFVWDGGRHCKIPQLGTVEIGDDVEIGANTTVDRASLGATVIGKGVKIDNLVQVAHNVTIGEHSIIVALVGIAGSATIGRNVVLAGQAGVRDHINVGNNVQAGGQTGITGDVPDNAAIMGTPHMPYKEWLKQQAYLKRLPDLFKKVTGIEEKMKPENDHG